MTAASVQPKNKEYLYTAGQESRPQISDHIITKYWPIFKLFFTGTFCGKFVIKWLLNIPLRLNCVATLECEM